MVRATTSVVADDIACTVVGLKRHDPSGSTLPNPLGGCDFEATHAATILPWLLGVFTCYDVLRHGGFLSVVSREGAVTAAPFPLLSLLRADKSPFLCFGVSLGPRLLVERPVQFPRWHAVRLEAETFVLHEGHKLIASGGLQALECVLDREADWFPHVFDCEEKFSVFVKFRFEITLLNWHSIKPKTKFLSGQHYLPRGKLQFRFGPVRE